MNGKSYPLLAQLVEDHRNFSIFLGLIEDQLERLQTGRRADLEIVELALAYLERYADQCHHPREDLIYDVLRAKDSGAARGSVKLADEHEAIELATTTTLRTIRGILEGDTLDMVSLEALIEDFVAMYRSHILNENQHLLPLAHERLDDEDWEKIEDRAAQLGMVERAFKVQERFRALRDYIHRLNRLLDE